MLLQTLQLMYDNYIYSSLSESQEMSGSGNNKKVQILRKLEGKFSLSAIGASTACTRKEISCKYLLMRLNYLTLI